MQLTSTAFAPNGPIPSRHTCDGENDNPPLSILEVPPEARGLALIVHDPDAVSGDFAHWVAWNLPPDTHEIKSGLVPPNAIEGVNDFGKNGYGGPCPPEGTGIHRYRFVLFALDTALELPVSAGRDDLLKAMAGHELARAELVGLYGKDDVDAAGDA